MTGAGDAGPVRAVLVDRAAAARVARRASAAAAVHVGLVTVLHTIVAGAGVRRAGRAPARAARPLSAAGRASAVPDRVGVDRRAGGRASRGVLPMLQPDHVVAPEEGDSAQE